MGRLRKTQVKLEGRGNSEIVFDWIRLAVRRKAHEVHEKKFVEVSLLRRQKTNLSLFLLGLTLFLFRRRQADPLSYCEKSEATPQSRGKGGRSYTHYHQESGRPFLDYWRDYDQMPTNE